MIGRGGIAAMLLLVIRVVALVVLSSPADQAILAPCIGAIRIVELPKVMRASKISGGLGWSTMPVSRQGSESTKL